MHFTEKLITLFQDYRPLIVIFGSSMLLARYSFAIRKRCGKGFGGMAGCYDCESRLLQSSSKRRIGTKDCKKPFCARCTCGVRALCRFWALPNIFMVCVFALRNLFSISSILVQTGSQVQAIIERNKEEVLTNAIPITARRRQFAWEVFGEAGTDEVL